MKSYSEKVHADMIHDDGIRSRSTSAKVAPDRREVQMITRPLASTPVIVQIVPQASIIHTS